MLWEMAQGKGPAAKKPKLDSEDVDIMKYISIKISDVDQNGGTENDTKPTPLVIVM